MSEGTKGGWHTRAQESAQEKGPFDAATLVEALKDGALSADVLVRRAGDEEWVALVNHPTFRRYCGADDRRGKAGRSRAFEAALDSLRSDSATLPQRQSAEPASVVATPARPRAFSRIGGAWVIAGGVACAVVLAISFWRAVGGRANAANAPSPVTTGSPSSAASKLGSWKYHSKEHEFSLTLPSPSWIQAKKGEPPAWSSGRAGLVDFSLGTARLASISSVERQTKEQFLESIPVFKALNASSVLVEGRGADSRVVLEPTFAQGTTDSGDPYIFASYANVVRDDQVVHCVRSRIWLKRRGITVTVSFEGVAAISGRVVEPFEGSTLERVARSICLSVEDEPQGPREPPTQPASTGD